MKRSRFIPWEKWYFERDWRYLLLNSVSFLSQEVAHVKKQ